MADLYVLHPKRKPRGLTGAHSDYRRSDYAFARDQREAGIEAVNPVSGPAWGKGRPVKAYATTFKTLTIGGVTIPGPRMELVEGRNFLGHDFAALVLGNDVLSRFHLYIAYRQQKLYLTDADAR